MFQFGRTPHPPEMIFFVYKAKKKMHFPLRKLKKRKKHKKTFILVTKKKYLFRGGGGSARTETCFIFFIFFLLHLPLMSLIWYHIGNLVILIQGAWEKIWFSGLGWVKQDKGAHWVYQALPIQEVRIHWGKESICLWVRICFLLSLGSVGENSGEDGATDLPPGQPCGRVWGHTRTLPGLLFYQYLG